MDFKLALGGWLCLPGPHIHWGLERFLITAAKGQGLFTPFPCPEKSGKHPCRPRVTFTLGKAQSHTESPEEERRPSLLVRSR
jgi:hypothetical protein